VSRAAGEPYDVVLMDVLMPVVDGAEATARIKEEWPDVQVIALTSFVDETLVERVLEAGAISYLLKDARPERLADAIREAYRGRGSIDSSALQALVHKKDDVPVAQQGERRADDVSLALLGNGFHAHPLLPGDIRSAVGRVVIEDHDLRAGQSGAELRDHRAYRRGFVEARDRDGDARRVLCGLQIRHGGGYHDKIHGLPCHHLADRLASPPVKRQRSRTCQTA